MGDLTVVLFQRSRFKLFTLKFSNKSVLSSSNESPKNAQQALFLLFENYNCFCFDPSRPTFYRKRTVSQRKRENAGNRWWGPDCKRAYLSHMPWFNKQQPGAILPALSPAHRAKGTRRSGTDGKIPLT
jgi:hypothetical protein